MHHESFKVFDNVLVGLIVSRSESAALRLALRRTVLLNDKLKTGVCLFV